MVLPVASFRQGYTFGVRGTMWSCNAVAGKGVHTGTDLLADTGSTVRAARPGKVKHVNFGSALGSHQIVVLNDDGTLDMYAHMRMRVADGTKVQAGQKVGEIGAEGNTNGTPHLHFERHRDQDGWRCGVHVDPKASLNFQAPAVVASVAASPAPRIDYTVPMQWTPGWWPEPGQPGSYYGPSTEGRPYYSGRVAGGTNSGWKASGRLDQRSIQTHIRLIQKAAGAEITGRYDIATRDKVKTWQIDHGVSPTKGLVGQVTWTAMARAHHQ